MFEHILAAIHQFARLTARSLRPKRLVVLELLTLEERATPAADMLFSVDPPEMITVAQLAPAKPIVRTDLVPFSCATKTDNADVSFTDADEEADELFAQDEHQSEADASEQVDESNSNELAVSQEELLAAKLNEELRQIAIVGA